MVIVQKPSNYVITALLFWCVYIMSMLLKSGTWAPSFLSKTYRMLCLQDPVQEMLHANRCNNIGSMMAFGYFQYVKTAIEEFKDRILAYEAGECLSAGQLRRMFLIVIPKSGSLRSFGSLKRARKLLLCQRDNAGTQNRSFYAPVYKNTDKKYGRKRPYFLLDVPMCLLLLNRLRSGVVNSLSAVAIQRIVLDFVSELSYLLQTDRNCRRMCRIQYYNDFLDEYPLDDLLENGCSLNPEIHLMQQLSSQNLGFSLAVQYFNFLDHRLKGFLQHVEYWEKRHHKRFYPKMVVAVHSSFKTLKVFNDWFDDDGLEELALPFGVHVADVGTMEDYPFEQSIYKLKQDTGIQYFTAVSPNTDHISQMIEKYRWRENVIAETRQEFVVELRRLIAENSPSYTPLCEVIEYDVDSGEKLSTIVMKLISNYQANES